MPISQIAWPCTARGRTDIYLDPYIDRSDNYGDRATISLWKDESNYLQWNGDPFMLGCPRAHCGNGRAEFPGTIFTLPYWMARYYSII